MGLVGRVVGGRSREILVRNTLELSLGYSMESSYSKTLSLLLYYRCVLGLLSASFKRVVSG